MRFLYTICMLVVHGALIVPLVFAMSTGGFDPSINRIDSCRSFITDLRRQQIRVLQAALDPNLVHKKVDGYPERSVITTVPPSTQSQSHRSSLGRPTSSVHALATSTEGSVELNQRQRALRDELSRQRPADSFDNFRVYELIRERELELEMGLILLFGPYHHHQATSIADILKLPLSDDDKKKQLRLNGHIFLQR
ncbi:MAG: hypothetical protein V4544_07440 [Pseudomonadota bacterium]